MQLLFNIIHVNTMYTYCTDALVEQTSVNNHLTLREVHCL